MKKPANSSSRKLEENVVGDLENFCDLLARENKYLKEAEWEKATALLPRKESYIQKFQAYIQKAKAITDKGGKLDRDFSPQMKKRFKRFTELMQQNEQFLKNAITAQTSLVRMVMDDVSPGERLGYGPNGCKISDDTGTTGLAVKNDA